MKAYAKGAKEEYRGTMSLPRGSKVLRGGYNKAYPEIVTHMKTGKYDLYTQVDYGKQRPYMRGYHVVNRTGAYALVPRGARRGR